MSKPDSPPSFVYCPDATKPLSREQFGKLFAGNQGLFAAHLADLVKRDLAKHNTSGIEVAVSGH